MQSRAPTRRLKSRIPCFSRHILRCTTSHRSDERTELSRREFCSAVISRFVPKRLCVVTHKLPSNTPPRYGRYEVKHSFVSSKAESWCYLAALFRTPRWNVPVATSHVYISCLRLEVCFFLCKTGRLSVQASKKFWSQSCKFCVPRKYEVNTLIHSCLRALLYRPKTSQSLNLFPR